MQNEIARSVTDLTLNRDPDMIWGMLENDDRISLRFDCGDAGIVMLTLKQADELIDFLQKMKSASTAPKKV